MLRILVRAACSFIHYNSWQMLLSRSIDPARLPVPWDKDKVSLGRERWAEAVDRQKDHNLHEFAAELAADPTARALLDGIFANSEFLTNSCIQDPIFTQMLFTEGVEAACSQSLDLVESGVADLDKANLARRLRQAKRRTALAIAFGDITGAWQLADVTSSLSRFAEASLEAALSHLLREAAAKQLLELSVDGSDNGLFVLGMGKLGAGELNYSSDIDLIVLFDPDRVRSSCPDRLQQTFVRLTRDLVRLLEERSEYGYVFRTDLRLRPDPASTPPAISVLAAETYYESIGQNWERAAMIKARPVAGDREAGEAFLDRLRPFLWRRHLDFAAIDDIRSIKRQIHAHKGGSTVAVEGHNIKLGRGGIREIELFAQTQQLIWGGRDPELRQRRTVDAMRALAATGRVRDGVMQRLVLAYGFLRTLEHRLQMVADQQTHSLPKTPEGVDQIAAFLGYRDPANFREELLDHLRAVESHYAALFEESSKLTSAGSLVFTGGEHDPETLQTLTQLGFQDAAAVSSAVRGWHHGRYRATRSARARELLTELMPALLEAFSSTANPDQAFRRFDAFLSRLPAGVQLFSLFCSNPSLLKLVAEIVGTAPRLADWLSRYPLLLDGVLDAGFYGPLPKRRVMAAELEESLRAARDMQDTLDLTRRWANDARFRAGSHLLLGLTDQAQSAAAYSDVAETVIEKLIPRLAAEFESKHGICPSGAFAVVGLGKLGGRELTAGSDLDLVFVYDMPKGDVRSDGPRPLSASQYYQRFGQRLINALTALTGEGKLYDVDMRLRPSGNAGPVAISLDGFASYHSEAAWTWEHLALTRARVIVGDAALRERIRSALRDVLCRSRAPDALVVDVDDMHERTFREKGHSANPWQIKHYPGGLVACEFIAQYLQLRHASDAPDVLDPNTIRSLESARDLGLLAPEMATPLIAATRLWQGIQGLLRLTVEGEALEETLPIALKRKLAGMAGASNFEALADEIRERADAVTGIYEALIGEPAAIVRARNNG